MKIHEYQARQLLADYGVPVPRGEVAATADEGAPDRRRHRRQGGRKGADPRRRTGQGRRRQVGRLARRRSRRRGRDARPGVSDSTDLAGRNSRPAGDGGRGDRHRARAIPRDSRGRRNRRARGNGQHRRRRRDRGRRRDQPREDSAGRGRPDIRPDAVPRTRACPSTGLARRIDTTGSRPDRPPVPAICTEKDCTLVEINPLVITSDGQIIALDAKIDLEDDALFRHPELTDLHDPCAGRPTGVAGGAGRAFIRETGGRPGGLHGERGGPGHGDHGHHEMGRR